jgi:HK97 family phage major capsid protein
MADINDKLGEIVNAFEELKNTNEQKISAEVKGAVDVLTTEKLGRINTDLTALQAAVTDLAVKGNRLGGSDRNADEEAHAAQFNKWARKGQGVEELETLEKKAMVIAGDGTQGGFALPKVVEAGVYRSLEVVSPIRNMATVIQIAGDDYRWLSVDGHVGAGWVGETDARPETSTPTLAENRVPMGEVYANPAVSQRALDDLGFDVEAFLAADIAYKFNAMENAAFLAGDGVNKPQGILTTTGITTVATGTGFASTLPTSGDYLFKMIQSLPAPYRAGAAFITASATLVSVRTMKDGNGNYIWQPSLVAGQPATLAGYDVVEIEDMPGVAAGALPVAFGNVKQGYLIADRIGIRTLRDPYTHKPFVHFYATKRVGGMVKDKKAFVFLKVATS